MGAMISHVFFIQLLCNGCWPRRLSEASFLYLGSITTSSPKPILPIGHFLTIWIEITGEWWFWGSAKTSTLPRSSVTKLKKEGISKGEHCFPFEWAAEVGWGGRIRTLEWRYQKPLPCHLATPQYVRRSASEAGWVYRIRAHFERSLLNWFFYSGHHLKFECE